MCSVPETGQYRTKVAIDQEVAYAFSTGTENSGDLDELERLLWIPFQNTRVFWNPTRKFEYCVVVRSPCDSTAFLLYMFSLTVSKSQCCTCSVIFNPILNQYTSDD